MCAPDCRYTPTSITSLTFALVLLCGNGYAGDNSATLREPASALALTPSSTPVRQTAVDQPAAVAVNTGDLIIYARHQTALTERSGQLQCMGTFSKLSSIGSPIIGSDGNGGSELKYGWTLDPADGEKYVTYFAIRATDPDTAGIGNKRCEHSYNDTAQLIPWNRTFWFSVGVKTGNLSDSKDQQSVWQWHDGSSSIGLSPYLAAIIYGNTIAIQLRHNQNTTLRHSNTTLTQLYKSFYWSSEVWHFFTVQARLNTTNNHESRIKIWLDGTKIVDYTGPVGYLYKSPKDYIKTGLYHWTNVGNTWDPVVQKREAWLKGPVMVNSIDTYDVNIIENLIR